MRSSLGLFCAFAVAAAALWFTVGPKEPGARLAEEEYPEDHPIPEDVEAAPAEAITH